MLHLLLGRSGFGKTHTVLARLEELARTEEPGLLVLLVPETARIYRQSLEREGAAGAPGPSSGRGCKGMELHQVGRCRVPRAGRASWTADG